MEANEAKEIVRNTLRSDAYWVINKELVKELGIKATLFLSDLLSKELFLEDKGWLKNGFFYYTKEDIADNTTLSIFLQDKVLKDLKKKDIVTTVRKGLPAKIHYKINHSKVLDLLKTRYKEIQELDHREFNHYNKNKKSKNKYSPPSKEGGGTVSAKRPKLGRLPIDYSSKSKEQKWSLDKAPATIRFLFDSWKELSCNGNKLHQPTSTAKATKRSVTILKQVLRGKHDKIPKLSSGKIKELFMKHSLEALNPAYEPHNSFKDKLRSLTIGDFFWNEWPAEDSPLKSRCLYLLEHEPRQCSELVRPLKDENPKLTNRMKRVYEKCIGGHKPDYNQLQLNKFIRASRRFKQFYDKIYPKLTMPESVYDLAGSLSEAILDHYGEGKIEIGNLCSSYTYDKIFPAYMHRQAMLRE